MPNTWRKASTNETRAFVPFVSVRRFLLLRAVARVVVPVAIGEVAQIHIGDLASVNAAEPAASPPTVRPTHILFGDLPDDPRAGLGQRLTTRQEHARFEEMTGQRQPLDNILRGDGPATMLGQKLRQ